jgi:hypothetical protein
MHRHMQRGLALRRVMLVCLIFELIYCLAEIEKFKFLREDLNNRAGWALAVLPNVLSKTSCSEMSGFIIPYDFSVCQ